MDTDDYSQAIDYEKLLLLARKYGPETLSDAHHPSDWRTADTAGQVVCPCLQGDACVCEALAEEFDRLTEIFRRKAQAQKPESCPDSERRWENEGGRVIAIAHRSGLLRLQ